MSGWATIVHDELDAVSLVYLNGDLADVLSLDATWEARLGALLESVESADEYLLAPHYRGLRAQRLESIPERALDAVPRDYDRSAEALSDILGLVVTWTIVVSADFIFGEENDPFGLF